MSAPNVTVVPPTGTLMPGSSVVFTWSVTDGDNRSLSFEWTGHDEQNNPVSGSGTIVITDKFTMDSFTLGGSNLTIDNANRRATGVVPSA